MLLSLEDQELRTMAKRANERMRALERFMKESGVEYNNAYDVARFQLEGKKRFKERGIDRMTQEQKDEMRYVVTTFLNNPVSLVKAARQQQNLKREIEKELKAAPKKKDKKPSLSKRERKEIEGQAILTSAKDSPKPGLNKRKEKQFWKIFNKAKEIFKDKTFTYKDLAKAITWRLSQGKGTTRQITAAMLKVVQEENLNRRRLFEAIGRA